MKLFELRPRHNATRFLDDNRGTVIVMFALSLVPLLVAAGVAVDYSRALAIKSDLQAAADAAALGAKRSDADETQAAKAKAEAIFNSNKQANAHKASLRSVKFNFSDDGVEVEAIADVPATLSKLVGVSDIEVKVTSRSMSATSNLELALVLDNTGSMRNDMAALRAAATELTETVFGSAGSGAKAKMTVVPYVGAVNIGNGSQQMGWMDVNAQSWYHGYNFNSHWIGRDPNCTPMNTGGSGTDPGASTGGSDRQGDAGQFLDGTSFGKWFAETFGASTAYAAGFGPFTQNDCMLINPNGVNHFDLFNAISNDTWKGCVEARPEPYDVQDTPPSTSQPDTLFVPYFWPDEPDVASSAGVTFPNNYMSDKSQNLPAPYTYQWEGSEWDWARQTSIAKYDGTAAENLDVAGPDTKGPNAACPDALLPLTESKSAVLSKIASLQHWEGSGTVSSEGLAWGWRVLSPEQPFTEGQPYDKAKKVIVLMTDGHNMAAEQASYATYSDYTAYGQVARARQPELATYQGYRDYLNSRLLAACTNAKAAGIEIYTVTFGAVDSDTENIYKQCATSPPMHYKAGAAEELVTAFQKIAMGLSELRLAQ